MNNQPELTPPNPMTGWQTEFLERSGALTILTGLPPSIVKVFLWLVVCEPAQQSAEQLGDTLGLSSAAISTATTSLIGRGLVERLTPHGERRFSYRLHPQGLERLMKYRLQATSQVRAVFDTAIAAAPTPQQRLTDLRDMYAWFETSITELLANKTTLS